MRINALKCRFCWLFTYNSLNSQSFNVIGSISTLFNIGVLVIKDPYFQIAFNPICGFPLRDNNKPLGVKYIAILLINVCVIFKQNYCHAT